MAADGSIYSIGALARLLGVSPATLRSWEERYAVVIPERSDGSQRLYSRVQLDQLLFVSDQMRHGLTAADAHRVLAEHLAGDLPLVVSDREEPAERRILLVERDPYAAELAEYFLRTEGYAVDVVRNVAEAEEVVREQSVDLAVVDLMIGGGAGLVLCEQLAPRVPVLAVSVLDQRDRAVEAGAQAFLHKPFESLALVSAVRDLIGTSAIVRAANRVSAG